MNARSIVSSGTASTGPLWLILLFGVATAGCQRGPSSSAGDGGEATRAAVPLPVQVQVAERRIRPAFEEIVGTVQSKLRATVEAKVSGRILNLPVRLGQTLRAGDLIAELDAREIHARYEQAVATRDQTARDVARLQRLLTDKVVSPSDFDDAQARFRVASASVTEAETMLGYTRLTAPFDGVVTRKHAEVGDLASPGKPLVDLEDPRQLRLEAHVPESAIGTLALGVVLEVRVANLTNTWKATISEAAPSADPVSRTFLVKCDLEPAPGLRAGQFGRAEIPMGNVAALRLPDSAVVRRGQLEMVFVLAHNTAALRLVRTGRQFPGEVEITAGLEPSEQVILNPPTGLVDGQPVTIGK